MQWSEFWQCKYLHMLFNHLQSYWLQHIYILKNQMEETFYKIGFENWTHQ